MSEQTKGQTPADNLVQFGFHTVGGSDIIFSEGHLQARSKDFNSINALIYAAKPIKFPGNRCTFEVVIKEYQSYPKGMFSINVGVIRLPAGTVLRQSEISTYTKAFCMWFADKLHNSLGGSGMAEKKYGTVSLDDLREGDRVGLRLTPSNNLHFFVNGKNQGVAVRDLLRKGSDIYPVVAVCFNCRAVKVTRAGQLTI